MRGLNIELFENKEVFIFLWVSYLAWELGFTFFLLLGRILAGDFLIDHLNSSFKNHSQLQNSVIVGVNFIELKDESFASFVDSQVVPLTPGSIVPELFAPDPAIAAFDFLELLHKFEVNSTDVEGVFEVGSFNRFAL